MSNTDCIPIFPSFIDTFWRAANRFKTNKFIADLKKNKNQAAVFPIISIKGGNVVMIDALMPRHIELLYQ